MSEPPRSCCAGFTRAESLRRAASVGSPASVREWDPRMPLPAGTGLDRRRFLLGAAGGLMSVYGAGRLGLAPSALREGVAQAAAAAPGRVLISLFLAGGVDSLSILAPVEDPLYRRSRPTLAVDPAGGMSFAEDPRLQWAPEAAPLAALHRGGRLSVLPAIGYTSPDLSHFTSRHYWEVGATDPRATTGWLGHYLDRVGDPTNPLQGLSMDGEMNPTLATARVPVAAIDTPESFSLWLENVWGDVFSLALDATTSLGQAQRAGRDRALAQVAGAAAEVGTVRGALARFRTADGGPAYHSPVAYPTASGTDLPQRLAGLAAMLAGGLPLRCVALTADTQFDTHSAQAGTLSSGFGLVAQALAAFQADLEARGIGDRVLVHVWSEFGRRIVENGSAGTDHGAGGLSLLMGTRVAGTMIGEWPGLARQDPNGNLIATTDFRALYSSLLEQWFGTDAAAIIPDAGSFPRYGLLR